MLLLESYTIKPRIWPVLLIFVLSGIPAMIIILTEPKKVAGMYLLGATCVFCLLPILYTRFFKIAIDDESLTFQFLGRRRTMLWKDVSSSTISWSVEAAHSAGPSWVYRSYSNRQIQIPLGYYSRSDLRLLAEQTIAKANQAEISPKIHNLLPASFPGTCSKIMALS
jgi:hypothetical protein